MTGTRTRYPLLHIAVLLGAVPFVIWRFQAHNTWPYFFLAAYLLTAYHIALLVIAYPGKGNPWYWKVVVASTGVHCVVVALFFFAGMALAAMRIKPPTGILFGLVGAALLLGARTRTHLVEKFISKNGFR